MKTIKASLFAALLVAGLSLASCGNSNRASDGEAAPENIGPVSDSVGNPGPDNMGEETTDTTINPNDSAQPAP